MNISCYYSIMATSKMDQLLKHFEETKTLSVKHHLETDEFDYYVMTDKSGNNTDFIQYKNKNLPESFFATRINTDDFEEMQKVLESKGYAVEGPIEDNDKVKLALFVSAKGEPNILVFKHK